MIYLLTLACALVAFMAIRRAMTGTGLSRPARIAYIVVGSMCPVLVGAVRILHR
jgi:hypothetical protein